MNPQQALQLLLLAAQAAKSAREAYQQFREVAKSAGVTEEQLAEADARFAEIRPDPLGIVE